MALLLSDDYVHRCMCVCHKGGALRHGICALMKGTPESSLIPSTMRGQSEKMAC